MSEQTKTKSQPTKRKILLTIFYLAWALVGTLVSQLIAGAFVAYVFVPIFVDWFGLSISRAFLIFLLYALTYTLTVLITIFVPPLVIQLYKKYQKPKKPQAVNELAQDLAPKLTDLGVQKPPTFVDIGLAPIAYFAYAIIASVIIKIMQQFPWFDVNQEQDIGFGAQIIGWDRIFAMFAVVLIAPVVEELIMRGWLYGKLRNKWNVVISMLLVSVLFGFMHGQWNVAISTFCLSIMLCTLREITGTIWSGMLLHILSNGVAFYMLYVVTIPAFT